MIETERPRGEPNRGDDDQHRAGEVSTEPIPRQPRPGTVADLLADPGADGRYRRAWLAQKIAHWQQHPPRYFTNPRPVPAPEPSWTPPSLVYDSAELVPAVDVAELVACGPGR